MIGIIDYGAGNLANVAAGVVRAGHEPLISGEAASLERCEKLILPGVGAFGDCAGMLRGSGLDALLDRWVSSGRPLLGVCVGMQLLFEKGEEFGETDGLGYLKGRVVRFDGSKAKVPHIGWNDLRVTRPDPILEGIRDGDYVYFVHSYYAAADPGDVCADTGYAGVRAPAVVSRGSVYGTQFHPEKSAKVGALILKNFLETAT